MCFVVSKHIESKLKIFALYSPTERYVAIFFIKIENMETKFYNPCDNRFMILRIVGDNLIIDLCANREKISLSTRARSRSLEKSPKNRQGLF